METLESVFRVNQWCDTLARLGQEARQIPTHVQTWQTLCDSLERRESEVAQLYEDNLDELRDLRNLSLNAIQQRADEISKDLVRQKAEFELLAEKAKAKLNQQ